MSGPLLGLPAAVDALTVWKDKTPMIATSLPLDVTGSGYLFCIGGYVTNSGTVDFTLVIDEVTMSTVTLGRSYTSSGDEAAVGNFYCIFRFNTGFSVTGTSIRFVAYVLD